MADPRWAAYGPFLWLRFRAFGVPDAFTAVDRWLRSTDADDAGRILVESTQYVLQLEAERDEAALRAFHCNAKQLRRILSANPDHRLVLVLGEMDGLEPDRAGEMAGVSAALARVAADGVRSELVALADDDPEGTQPDSHMSTVDFLGYANETLGPMRAGQIEQHLASCSACYQRFEIWSDAVESFGAMAPPAPPAAPPDRGPLLAMVFGLLCSLFVVGVGVGVVLLSTGDRAAESTAFAMQTPQVQLVVDGRTGVDVSNLAAGKLIQVRYDPKYAHYVGLGLRTSAGPRVLLVGAVPDPSVEQLAPLELLHAPDDNQTLYVAISDRVLAAEDVLAVLDGTAAPDVSVAVVPL